MQTNKLTKIAMLGAILFICFTFFSFSLYIEVITLLVVVMALVFPKKEVLFIVLIFTLLNLTIQGITIWSLLYIVVYSTYATITIRLRQQLLAHEYRVMLLVGVFSFLTGMILDLPYFLFSKELTYMYLLLGLQTSLIQAIIACIEVLLFYKPLYQVLKRLEGGTK